MLQCVYVCFRVSVRVYVYFRVCVSLCVLQCMLGFVLGCVLRRRPGNWAAQAQRPSAGRTSSCWGKSALVLVRPSVDQVRPTTVPRAIGFAQSPLTEMLLLLQSIIPAHLDPRGTQCLGTMA